ncbi:MAG: glycosyltransferase family 2 protein, partial [Candidatus Latescibacteria bacterium]|nr:glycosyltransferase family 2 protein [Candidatus Latescibacterota bacterium]
PAYNEQESIVDCMTQFRDCSDDVEIIVVDGGSTDDTLTVVQAHGGIRCVRHPINGRAMQLNAGAKEARGSILLFLHADTSLPDRWSDLIVKSLGDDRVAGGRFRLSISEDTAVFRWIARGSNFRSRKLGISYGDQAIYAAREAFNKVNGFPEIPIFEDSEFCVRLKSVGIFDWIDDPVITSARRWQSRGPVRTILLTWILRLLFLLSVSPETLSRYYRAVR